MTNWFRRGRQVRELAAVARRYRRERDDHRDALAALRRAVVYHPMAMDETVAAAVRQAAEVLNHPASP